MKLALLSVLVSGLGSITYGYSASVISTTLAQPSFLAKFGLATRPDAVTLISLITSLSQVGGLLGVLSMAWLADRFGRKATLAICSIWAIICFALQAGSEGIGMFIAFRALGGIATGLFLSAVPLYIGECAPTNIRGFLTNCHGTAFATGYIIASWAAVGFVQRAEAWSWRLPLAIQGIFPLLLLPLLPFIPESPRYLVLKGQHDKALGVLNKIHGTGDLSNITPEVQHEYNLLVEQDRLDRTEPITWGDIFRKPSYRKRLILGWLTTFQYPALGTLIIYNYLGALLTQLGYAGVRLIVFIAGYITLTPPFNFLSSVLIDRLGRRKMLLIGSIGCILWLICETITIAQGLGTASGSAAAVAFLFIQLAWFAAFQDGVTFTYSSEIWPNRVRAKGFALSMTGFFTGSSLFLGTSYDAFTNISFYFYLPFIFTSSVITVLIYLYWPETNKVPLETLAKVFGDPVVEEDRLGAEAYTEKEPRK